jgi:thiamine-phosphate pyrophosphorylase
VALQAGADVVHLGRGGPDAVTARAALGEAAWIGASLHGRADLERGDREEIDYFLASPVFATESKPGVPPLGLVTLADLCRRAGRPILALGGVTAANAARCLEAGATGVAVVGALSGGEPEVAWRRLADAVAPGAAAVSPREV